MSHSFSSRPARLSIAATERDTGLSKDTLRIWERRYGFPQPERDALGERAYSLAQVDKLRLIKRLMDSGHRPGRIVPMPIGDLQSLLDSAWPAAPEAEAPAAAPQLQACVDCMRAHDVEGLRQTLTQAQLRWGLGRFVTEVVVPLNTLVGDAWMRGQLEVFEEHLYTESVQVVLRNALHQLPGGTPARGPGVLLTTFPGEPHGLGLLMAEALFALEGCRCVSLGIQTPVWDIVLAASACKTDIVALSFTGCTSPNQVIDGLVELRAKLPPSVAVWAGGSAPVLHRRPVPGVLALSTLERVADELAAWRAASRSAAPAYNML